MTFNPWEKDSKLYYNIMCKIKACIEKIYQNYGFDTMKHRVE
jgi:hypothetical protein